MCGIAGIFNTSDAAIDRSRLSKMAAVLQHRGPDNRSGQSEGSIGFERNSLSLLDLCGNDNHPFCDDSYSLIYNGEIYNFLELRRELESEGVRFRSSSDTEVLFHLLRCKGVKA